MSNAFRILALLMIFLSFYVVASMADMCRDYWLCIDEKTSVHYSNCSVDKVLNCLFYCSAGKCVGENECTYDYQCKNYCDVNTSRLYKDAYCKETGTCYWKSFEYCAYGCSPLNTCAPKPLLTEVIIPQFASFMGIGIEDAKTMVSVLLSLVISTIITYLICYKTSIGKFSLIFGVLFVVLVSFFAYIQWINIILYVIIISIVGSIIMYSVVR